VSKTNIHHRSSLEAAYQSAGPDPTEGYQEFLDALVAAARQFGFRPEKTPSRDDPRIRGLRQ